MHDVILYKGTYPAPGGGVGGIIGTIVDLTDVRTAERALREETEARCRDMASLAEKEKMLILQSRQAAMGQMIGNIAHQWRQPLNMLALVSQEILIVFDDGRLTREYLEVSIGKMQKIIQHMSQTIEDFRRFFSPDKAKQRFSTREIVERALYLLDGELKELNVKVDVLCGEECHIDGYPNEYMQVIINIINNARDVVHERRVADPRIDIRLFHESGRSVVTIADNGGGIAPGILEQIFDPYFTTKSSEKGTGIGLFMSRNIIEHNMGGTLTVSNTREGAEFRIEV